MKILEEPTPLDDGGLQYTAYLSKEEVQTLLEFATNMTAYADVEQTLDWNVHNLLQFAINASASIGLGVDARWREAHAEDSDEEQELQ